MLKLACDILGLNMGSRKKNPFFNGIVFKFVTPLDLKDIGTSPWEKKIKKNIFL